MGKDKISFKIELMTGGVVKFEDGGFDKDFRVFMAKSDKGAVVIPLHSIRKITLEKKRDK